MSSRLLLLVAALLAPAFAGCIASAGDEALSVLAADFTVGQYVADLAEETGASMVNARVAHLAIEFNQTRATLIEWRSFAANGDRCDLVSTMLYAGLSGTGGFLVHKQGEPCPLTLAGRPSVAEVVALVDRVPLSMVQRDVVGNAPLFSLELAGTCAYTQTAVNGTGTPVYVWNGQGLDATTGDVVCKGGHRAALALSVTVPDLGPTRPGQQSTIILEQVPSR